MAVPRPAHHVSGERGCGRRALGGRLAHTRGVTAVHDKDGWLGALGVWQRLQHELGLGIRVWQSLPYERLPELVELGLRPRLGDDFLGLGYLKAFMDGTLGSRTAAMLDGSGVCITTSEELADIVRRAAHAGWPLAVHAIGDRANREALDAFAATHEEWSSRGLRPRIEHAQLVDPVDLPLRRPRRSLLGAVLPRAVGPGPGRPLVAGCEGRLRVPGSLGQRCGGGQRLRCAGRGPRPAPRHPAGVARTLDDRAAWHPEQSLTVEEAIVASTVNPAWLAGDERNRGRLVPGCLADLVVLDRDPLCCRPDELATLEVVATMVAGRWVHNPPPWS